MSHKALKKPQGLNSLSQQTLLLPCHGRSLALPGSDRKVGRRVLAFQASTAVGRQTNGQNSTQPVTHLRSEQSARGERRRSQLCWESEGSFSEGTHVLDVEIRSGSCATGAPQWSWEERKGNFQLLDKWSVKSLEGPLKASARVTGRHVFEEGLWQH